MSLSFESAQDFGMKVLKSHLTQDRLSHAYLLTGDLCGSKLDLSLAFAAAVNCQNKKYFEDCSCSSCQKIGKGLHSDVHLVGADEDLKSIKIAEVRKVISEAALKPYEGQFKVFIIIGAQRMTVDASNSLLKTLEEPPAQSLFILLVDHRAHLLETIQSRCFELRLKPDPNSLEEPESDFSRFRYWDQFFMDYEKISRSELKSNLNQLAEDLRMRMQRVNGDSNATFGSYLEAIKKIIETGEALNANVNQKLALTRLAVHLERYMPLRK